MSDRISPSSFRLGTLRASKILFDLKLELKDLNNDNHRSKKDIKTSRRVCVSYGEKNRTVNMITRLLLAGHRYRGSNPYRSDSLSSP
jgi:hypothetical protein